jgi:hypothetical protein
LLREVAEAAQGGERYPRKSDGGGDGDDGAIGGDAYAGDELEADDGAENGEENAEQEAGGLEDRRVSSSLLSRFSFGRHAA